MSARTDLLHALDKGNLEFFTNTLESHPQLLDFRGHDGATLLHLAARKRQQEITVLLLEKGLDPNLLNQENRSALHDSFEHGATGISQLLIDHGAAIDICYASAVGDLEKMKLLLEANPELIHDYSTGLTPIEWAAYGNSGEAIKLLHQYGLDVNHQDPEKASTALMAAAQCNNCHAARTILELGGDPNLASIEGLTPLHYAAAMDFSNDTTHVTAIMLAYDAQVNRRSQQNLTPLGMLKHTQKMRPDPERNYDGLKTLLEVHGATV